MDRNLKQNRLFILVAFTLMGMATFTAAGSDGTHLPQLEKSLSQKAAERKLEKQMAELEAKIANEEDTFLKSDKGKKTRERIERNDTEVYFRICELRTEIRVLRDKELREFNYPPRCIYIPSHDVRVRLNQITVMRAQFQKEKGKMIEVGMEKADPERAKKVNRLKKVLAQTLADLKKLKDLPLVPRVGRS